MLDANLNRSLQRTQWELIHHKKGNRTQWQNCQFCSTPRGSRQTCHHDFVLTSEKKDVSLENNLKATTCSQTKNSKNDHKHAWRILLSTFKIRKVLYRSPPLPRFLDIFKGGGSVAIPNRAAPAAGVVFLGKSKSTIHMKFSVYNFKLYFLAEHCIEILPFHEAYKNNGKKIEAGSSCE